MKTIVERLRDVGGRQVLAPSILNTVEDAAREIERLRKALGKINYIHAKGGDVGVAISEAAELLD